MSTPQTSLDDAALARDAQTGLFAGLTCYLLWGFLPLLFKQMEQLGAVTIVADRTVFTLIFMGLILVLSRRTAEVMAVLRDGKMMRSMFICSLLLAFNWLVFVWAIENGQVIEASFGYFINPLINVVIGMALLGERQNPWQWVSIGVAVIALVIQTIGLGHFPYIAMGIALSFGFYGYARKTLNVNSATGLFAETLLIVPLALAYLAYTFIRDGGIGLHADPGQLLLVLLSGPATAVPLLLFTFAVRRLRYTTIGMLQYLSPSITFVLAITVFGEQINQIRLLSFGLIWLSLAIYTADSFRRRSRAHA